MEKKLTYGVWAVRSSTSIFGPAQSWCKENGKPLEFDTKADAENYAKEAIDKAAAKRVLDTAGNAEDFAAVKDIRRPPAGGRWVCADPDPG